jgi:hypothetical protein
LGSARNPLLEAYGLPQGGSVVGLQFAFRSMDYAREVDSNVAAFRSQTGVRPAVVGAYFDFAARADKLGIFLRAVRAQACVPSVTLDPKYYGRDDTRYQKTFLHRIESGLFDAELSAWARELADFAQPVLLRFAHEMNGDWYPYGGGGDADGNGHPDGPEAFIRAWKHVHDLFSAEGATNLIWVFCPNGEDFPERGWNRPFGYYPGDAYADLIFVDAYEHHEKRTQSLESAMAHFLGELGGFLRQRPAAGDSSLPAFGLGEFGTNRKDPAAKAEWYRQSLGYLGEESRLGFHFLYNGQNGEQDFSLRDTGGLIGDAYRQSSFRYDLIGLPLPKRRASLALR